MKNYYWDAIISYMNDDLREEVHAELAPCSPKDFLARYLEIDPDFQDLLDDEFSPEYVRAALVDKPHYLPIDWDTFDIFGPGNPTCIDRAECERLARDYDLDLDYFMSEMREATMQELQIYGTYDAECQGPSPW